MKKSTTNYKGYRLIITGSGCGYVLIVNRFNRLVWCEMRLDDAAAWIDANIRKRRGI